MLNVVLIYDEGLTKFSSLSRKHPLMSNIKSQTTSDLGHRHSTPSLESWQFGNSITNVHAL